MAHTRCDACGALLIGQYVIQDGTALCTSCHASLPRCARCTRSLIEGRRHQGRPYCARCYAEGERCDLCGDICRGRYFTHPQAGTFCAPCKEAATSCSRCGAPTLTPRPIEPAGGGATLALCTTCFDEVPTCHHCGLALTGRYYTHPRTPGRRFCAGCMDAARRCDFCGAPTSDAEAMPYADGRLSCPRCRASAVLKQEALVAIERRARNWMFKHLEMRLRPSRACPVHLSDADAIAHLQDKTFSPTPGFDLRERGLFLSQVRTWTRAGQVVKEEVDLSIHLERGLPLKDALGTMVHELTHLWQFDNFPRYDRVDRRWLEGLACWTQRLALLEHDADDAAEMVLNNPDPIYGGGLRMVMDLERRVGQSRVLEEVVRRVGG